MISTSSSNTKAKRHLFWPLLISGLIGFHILSVVTMVVVATHDRSFAVEPNFYQKGLHYEQTIDQRRENARLGWTIKLAVGPPESGTYQRNVTCRLTDREGKPLDGTKIDVIAFAHLCASKIKSCVLLPQDFGEYAGTLDFPDPGRWEFRFVVTRGKDTFTSVVKQEIGGIAAGD
jgi:nitrogen fixation protein FixH